MKNVLAPALVATVLFCSAEFAGDKARVQALANVSAIVPGQPFMLGFKFSIDPGWHIYWKNAGDSGLPTEIKLSLPAGFTAGPLQFPVPSRLEFPGNIVNYAYENQVMMMVRITSPKDLPVGSTMKLTGKANWLVCQNSCETGSANISVDLPVAASSTQENSALFTDWESRLPVTSDPANIVSMSNTLSIVNGDCQDSILVDWKKAPSDVQFIPGPMTGGDIENVKITVLGNTTKITCKVPGYKGDEPVTGLLTFTSASGAKVGVETSIQGGMAAK